MNRAIATLLLGGFLLAGPVFAPPSVAGCANGSGYCTGYQTPAAGAGAYNVAQSYYSLESDHSNTNVIPPSQALQYALQYAPGSQGLGVRLVAGQRLMYAVKLRIGNQVRRILIDARTGQIVGQ